MAGSNYNFTENGQVIPFEDAFDSLKEKTVKEGQLIYG